MSIKPVQIGPHTCGQGEPLLVIAGPCVLESADAALLIAESLKEIADRLPIQLVFKASFDKANRTSVSSYRGPGLHDGLEILAKVRDATGLPVTTDVHESHQCGAVGEVCDLIQIPAFLCRQTDLLLAASQTGRAVNVKKGQFLSPGDMQYVLQKLSSADCRGAMLCERGTFFGYGRLTVDMRSLVEMRSFGVPVIYDATHSVQEPGGLGGRTGGNRAMVEPLARAAAAVGVDGMFFETHPEPDKSPSDGPNMIPLAEFQGTLERVLRVRAAVETRS